MERAALFDVDGTLTDTNHLHIVAWWEALRQADHVVPMQAVHRALGRPSSDLLEELLGKERDREQDGELTAAHSALYGQYFDRLAAFPGAGDLLRELAADGWRIVLVTSAGGSELKALRRAIDADDAIFATASADDVSEGKPAPEPVEHALRLAEVAAAQAVFIGDSVWDMKAAVRAGVRAVAVLSGGIPRADLEAAGAREVFDDPADLLSHLKSGSLALGLDRPARS
ncbi:HAD family hydrolase [Streptomyces sp. N35]|uniref:HAD family hydrolase n=1 Tax=Streptomyces sp. N35 TaxID=2795730 RepID=UPI0018F47EFF|nr:HAD family hydrolase [Streptomyces sp. N35]